MSDEVPTPTNEKYLSEAKELLSPVASGSLAPSPQSTREVGDAADEARALLGDDFTMMLDADTFRTAEGEDIRTKGDAPEGFHEGKIDYSPMSKYAEEATRILRGEGAEVKATGGRDVHGRQLGELQYEDGSDTSGDMIEAGLMSATNFGEDGAEMQSRIRGVARAAMGMDRTHNESLKEVSAAAEVERQMFDWNPFESGGQKNSRPYDRRGAFSKAFDRGIEQSKESLGGVLNYIGDAIGDKEWQEAGREYANRARREASFSPREIEDFSKINGLDDAFTYLVETTGELAPGLMMDAAIAAGTMGTGVGAVVVRRAGAAALRKAVKAGAITGPLASGYIQAAGDMENRLDEADDRAGREGETHGIRSTVSGLLGGVVELAPLAAIAGDVLKASGAKKEVIDAIVKATDEGAKKSLLKRSGAVATDIGKTTAKGAASEGGAELIQTILDEAVFSTGNDNEWNLDTKQAVEAMLRGVGGGAVMGAGASTMAHSARKVFDEYDLARTQAAEESQSNPDGGDWQPEKQRMQEDLDAGGERPIDRSGKVDSSSEALNPGDVVKGDTKEEAAPEGVTGKGTVTSRDIPNPSRAKYQSLKAMLTEGGKVLPWAKARKVIGRNLDPMNPRSPKVTEQDLLEFMASNQRGANIPIVGKGNNDKKLGAYRARLNQYIDASFDDGWRSEHGEFGTGKNRAMFSPEQLKYVPEDIRQTMNDLNDNPDATVEDFERFFTTEGFNLFKAPDISKQVFEPDVRKTWADQFGIDDKQNKPSAPKDGNDTEWFRAEYNRLKEKGVPDEEAVQMVVAKVEQQKKRDKSLADDKAAAEASRLKVRRAEAQSTRADDAENREKERLQRVNADFFSDEDDMSPEDQTILDAELARDENDMLGLTEITDQEFIAQDGVQGVRVNYQRRKAQATDAVVQLAQDKDLVEAGIVDFMDGLEIATEEERNTLSKEDLEAEDGDSKMNRRIVFEGDGYESRVEATGKGARSESMTRTITKAEKKKLLEIVMTGDKTAFVEQLSRMRLLSDVAETGDSEKAPQAATVLGMINKFRKNKSSQESKALTDEITTNEAEKLIGRPVDVQVTYPSGESRTVQVSAADVTSFGARDVGLDLQSLDPKDRNFMEHLARAFHAGLSKINATGEFDSDSSFGFTVDFNNLPGEAIIFETSPGKGYTLNSVRGTKVSVDASRGKKVALAEYDIERAENIIDILTGDSPKGMTEDSLEGAYLANLLVTYKSLVKRLRSLKQADSDKGVTNETLSKKALKQEIERVATEVDNIINADLFEDMRFSRNEDGDVVTEEAISLEEGGGFTPNEVDGVREDPTPENRNREHQGRNTKQKHVLPANPPPLKDGVDTELGTENTLSPARTKMVNQKLARRSTLLPVVRAMNKIFGTVRSRLENINPVLADALFTRAGAGATGGSFERSSRMRYEQKLVQFRAALGENSEVIKRAWEQALTGDPKTPNGKKLLKFANDFHAEIKANNPNYKGEGIPFVFDTREIDTKRKGFLAILEKHGIKDPKDFMDTVLDSRGSADHGIHTSPGGVRGVRRRNVEVKAAMDDLRKAGFIETDAATSLNRFMASGTAFSEWSRIFGAKDKKGDFYESMFFDHLMTQTSPSDLDEVMKLVSASLGRVSQVPSWVNQLNSGLFAFHAGTILWFSGVASIPEIATVVSRSRGDVDGILKDVVKLGSGAHRKDLEVLARSLETATSGVTRDSMMNLYASGELSTGKVSEKISSTVFKLNGQEFITNLSRTFATSVGRDYVDGHLIKASQGNARSIRALKELGISGTDIASLFQLRLASQQEGGNLDLNSALGGKWRDAIHRFVDDSVSNPHAGQMPLWMSDPRWQVVASLKKFFYAFWDNFHRQMHSEYGKGRKEGVSMPRAVLPMALAAAAIMPLAMIAEALRELIKYPFGLGRTKPFDGHAYLLNSLNATGGLGPMTMAQAANEQSGYGRNMGVALAGPTASLIDDMVRGKLNPSRFLGPINQQPWARNQTNEAYRDLKDWLTNG